MALKSAVLAGATGPLELLYSLPENPTVAKPPLLFIHGSFCSAHCFMYFLPFFARHGYPAYAISVRGHGASHPQSWVAKMLCTSLESWGSDAKTALTHITAAHPGSPPPVLGGHSLGGGAVQLMISHLLLHPFKISAIVLLAASPLTGGGMEIAKNWEHVESPGGYPHLWSARCTLETVTQVRAAFFSNEASDEVVQAWIDKCKTPEESMRAGMHIIFPVGKASDILDELVGLGSLGQERKVLCVAGTADRLIPPEMVSKNTEAYQVAAEASGNAKAGCESLVVEGSAHHLMMDAYWENCAKSVLAWLDGEE